MLYKDDGQGLDDGSSFITKYILGGEGFVPAFFFINNSLLSFSWIFAAVAPRGEGPSL